MFANKKSSFNFSVHSVQFQRNQLKQGIHKNLQALRQILLNCQHQKKKKGEHWSESQTKTLVSLWKEHFHDKQTSK